MVLAFFLYSFPKEVKKSSVPNMLLSDDEIMGNFDDWNKFYDTKVRVSTVSSIGSKEASDEYSNSP